MSQPSAPTVPTPPTPTAPTRVFRYGDHTFPDPGPEVTTEQVCRSLLPYFPELARATHHETALPDGTLEISFQKQITTKGADAAEPLLPQLTALLTDLPPYQDPLGILVAEGVLSPVMDTAALYAAHERIQDAYDATREIERDLHHLVERCQTLAPQPSRAWCPLGF